MADEDKKITDTDDEPVKEAEVEEPKAEELSDTAAPAGDAVTPAGTDQQGRQLYSVKCAKCGKQTQVPFKPSGGRPVYCRDCYMAQRG